MLAMYMFSFSPLDTSKFTSLSALYSTMSNVWCFYIHGCWFIHWSMINLTGTISLEKTKSSFSIHQLLITFYLKTGIHEPLHLLPSILYLLLSYPEDTVLCLSSTTLFLKIFFYLLCSDFSLNLGYRMCYTSHLGPNSP